jgi:deoxycytidylate deaminase
MRHLSSIVKGKNNVLNSLSIGYNHTRCYNINCTVHAEVNAVDKLKPRNRNKKLYEVNIMVIRVNNSGALCSSKPCENCLNYMRTVSVKKGYKIKKIYYSTSDRTIDQMQL